MLDWIRHCFAPSLPPLSSAKRTLLVLDSHRADITAACYQFSMNSMLMLLLFLDVRVLSLI